MGVPQHLPTLNLKIKKIIAYARPTAWGALAASRKALLVTHREKVFSGKRIRGSLYAPPALDCAAEESSDGSHQSNLQTIREDFSEMTTPNLVLTYSRGVARSSCAPSQ